MERLEETDVDLEAPTRRLLSVLDSAPVRLAILFGSSATGRTHEGSDVDIAVELDGLRPGDDGYNAAFLGLSADLADALETDDIDLVDVHSLSPSLARSVFDTGVLLRGDPERADVLRRDLVSAEAGEHSPRERFDDAVRRIDEHLA